jgi:hypothetical protein
MHIYSNVDTLLQKLRLNLQAHDQISCRIFTTVGMPAVWVQDSSASLVTASCCYNSITLLTSQLCLKAWRLMSWFSVHAKLLYLYNTIHFIRWRSSLRESASDPPWYCTLHLIFCMFCYELHNGIMFICISVCTLHHQNRRKDWWILRLFSDAF